MDAGAPPNPAAAEPPVGGLVAVHAHPDDETLSTGALLATWAASGRPVTVVTCTRGEQGEVIGTELAHLEGDGPALAAHREGELARAVEALGVREQVFLDALVERVTGTPCRYADSGMAWAGVAQAGAVDVLPPDAFVAAALDEAAAGLAALLRQRRPEVVVGYEPGGGYGHPDHVRAHEVMMRAVELAAADPADGRSHRVPVVLWAALDEHALRAGYRTTAADDTPLSRRDPDGPVPSAAVPSRDVDVRVDVAPVLPAVLAALRAHRTQVQAVTERCPAAGAAGVLATYALSDDVLTPLLAEESHRYAPGRRHDPVAWPTGVRPTVA